MSDSAQLLIIGNGFDLHCGLPSSYKSFFESTILDTHGEHFGLKQLKSNVSGFWEGLLLEYYKVNKDDKYNWCDIESIIQNTLWYINSNLWKRALDFTRTNQDPMDYNELNGSVDKYLFRYCALFFYDLAKQRTSNSEKAELQCLLTKILQELNNFEKRFCKYIRHNIVQENGKGLNTQYIINAVNLLADLTNFTDYLYSDIWQMVVRPQNAPLRLMRNYKLADEFSKLKDTYILSFNYTSVFDYLLVKSPCAYNNVHGKLCESACEKDCKASSVIFGIDDSLIQAKRENSELRLFSKTYRKMTGIVAPAKIMPSNDIPVTIKFYGHSLSKADYSYFQSIFDYYNIYGNNNVDLIFYYSKGYEQTDAIYRLINSYGQSFDNKEQGKNLMHKLLLENRLKMQEIE